jgi:NTE family protein
MDDTMTRHQGGTPPAAGQKPVNLALQGGGAHGAFAWGVLDRLLEDGRLTIDAMSATSAGAMNAVVAAVVLASACLPHLFHAVEIDGEHYWDGGFMGNPAIFPLIYNRGSKDVILVHINPIERKKLPKTAAEIFNRMDEISFNSSLMREMRAVAFVTKLIDDNVLDRGKYSRMLIHSIRDDAAMAELGVATKLNPDWDYLCRLRDSGRVKTAEWLDSNFDKVGQSSTVDLTEIFF